MKNRAIATIRRSACLLLLLVLPLSALTLASALPSAGEFMVAAAVSARESAVFREYEIKAGFIYRFISFVSWPEDQFVDGVFTIGILGQNPFGDAFDAVAGSTVGGRVVRIRHFGNPANIEELKTCQILFISSVEEGMLRKIIGSLADSPTLTIGDMAGFIDNQGMIGFVRRGSDRVGLEINAGAASRSGLSIRSVLKRLAVRIIDEPEYTKEVSRANRQ